MKLEQYLAQSDGVMVADIRKALVKKAPKDGVYFGVKTSNKGPFKLLWLGIDLDVAASDLNKTGDTLVVNVTEYFKPPKKPKVIRWAIGAGHDIPKIATHLIIVRKTKKKVHKLGQTKGILKQGKVWRGAKERSKPKWSE